MSDIQGCTPGQCAMNSFIADTAVDRFIIILPKIKDNPYVYIILDKANSKKAGAKSATFPKILIFYCKKTKQIYEFLLDCDATGSSTAEAISNAKKTTQ